MIFKNRVDPDEEEETTTTDTEAEAETTYTGGIGALDYTPGGFTPFA